MFHTVNAYLFIACLFTATLPTWSFKYMFYCVFGLGHHKLQTTEKHQIFLTKEKVYLDHGDWAGFRQGLLLIWNTIGPFSSQGQTSISNSHIFFITGDRLHFLKTLWKSEWVNDDQSMIIKRKGLCARHPKPIRCSPHSL